MKYYRVKPEYDNMQVLRNGRYRGILIGKELYTEKEFQREFSSSTAFRGYGYGATLNPATPENCLQFFDKVEIKKTDTYWSFGARFQCRIKGYRKGEKNERR